MEGDRPKRSKFRRHPVGHLHVDLAEVRTEAGGPHLSAAVDRTSKLAVVRLIESANRRTARELPEAPIEAVPRRIRAILTGEPSKAPSVRARWRAASGSPAASRTSTPSPTSSGSPAPSTRHDRSDRWRGMARHGASSGTG
jgi:hypothetical protein